MFRLILPLFLLAPLALVLLRPTPASAPAPRLDVRTLIDEAAIEPGDLVFRRGRTWLSRAVAEADPAADFSHVGIAVVNGPRLLVVHASPDKEGEEGGVFAEPLDSYLAPDSARAAAVYRVPELAVAFQASKVARAWAEEARPFDAALEADYGDATEASLYCTELVWKAYLHAGIDLMRGTLDTVDLPLGPDRYVLPSSLMAAEETIEMQRAPGKESS